MTYASLTPDNDTVPSYWIARGERHHDVLSPRYQAPCVQYFRVAKGVRGTGIVPSTRGQACCLRKLCKSSVPTNGPFSFVRGQSNRKAVPN